nr:transposase [uncultured archaeon GZfos27G5]
MEHTPEEEERIKAIQRCLEGEREVEIYRSLERSKGWFSKWLGRYKTGRKGWYKDLPKRARVIPHKTSERIEQIVVNIRKALMDGTEDSTKYSCVGAEAIQFHMEELGYKPSEIPSISTIKRIIKRNKLRANKPERYKRVRSKGRYTILNPKHIDELHQLDYVGPRHIKGYGPINSIHLKDVAGRQVAGQQYNEKSMDNVMDFLMGYWKQCPIPKYLQVDNGMCFAGDYKHPKSFSRFVRLALYVGIEVVFIAPSRPWMNGTIEEFNKGFDKRFWQKELFTDLNDIRKKSVIFFEKENKFNAWKLRNEKLKVVDPKRMLPGDFTITVNRLPLVTGEIHFIRRVDSRGKISVLNEYFDVGREYTGEYVWATIETMKQTHIVYYKDENLVVREIKKFGYEIDEKVRNRKDSIFKSCS